MDDPFPYEDENTVQQSWFKHNCLWAIPLLILGGCYAIGVCFTAIFGIIFAILVYLMRWRWHRAS